MASNFEQLIFEIIATDKNASAAFDRFRGTVDKTSRSIDDNTGKLDKNAKSIDSLAKSAGGATPAVGGLGGASGMGLLIGAGVALAPVLATVGIGLAGFGAAAFGAIAPVVKAAQATGGLQANMAKLNPEQQQLAQSILGLGKQYQAFSKSLQPEVLGVFGKGVQLAGHLMKDIQPIAAATGKALGSLLDRIDAEFQSGQWQQFFTWMATQAGPDIQQLGTLIIDLTKDLPPLLEALQPVSHDFLTMADAVAKAAGAYANFINTEEKKGQQQGSFGKQISDFFHELLRTGTPAEIQHAAAAAAAAKQQQALNQRLAEGGAATADLIHPLGVVSTGLTSAGSAAAAAALATADLIHPLPAAAGGMSVAATTARLMAGELKKLNTQLATAVSQFLSLPGATTNAITAFQTFRTQSKLSGASLSGVNQNSLTLQSTLETGLLPQVQDLITKMVNSHQPAKSLATVFSTLLTPAVHDGALKNNDLRNAIFAMAQEAGYAGPNKVKPLRDWMDRYHTALSNIPKIINTHVSLTGTGGGLISYIQHVAQEKTAKGTLEFHAAGGLVRGGIPGRDSVLGMLMPGEVIVPAAMVKAGAVDHLRGRLPRFASGGLVDTTRSTASLTANGNPTTGGPWMSGIEGRFGDAVLRAFGAAAAAALKAAVAAHARSLAAAAVGALGGPTSASAAQAQAYARSRLGAYGWGSGQMGSLIALWNQESGWNRFARNASSGAYGIPQALPPGKMGAAANPPTSSAAAQINWGLGYIKGRYGSPAGAEAHERAFNWYDNSGWLPTGPSLSYNGTGQPEAVIGGAPLARVEMLLGQILAAARVAPAATSAGTARALNSAARGAMGAR